jgi:hypothetical protein
MAKKKEPQKFGDALLGWVQKNVEKPCKELAEVAPSWESHAPANARQHARLVSYRNGVLKVACDSTTARASLSMALRGGLLAQLKGEAKRLWKVKLVVEPQEGAEEGRRGEA